MNFDSISVRRFQDQAPVSGKANLWPDPGFENPMASPNATMAGAGGEGLHSLTVDAATVFSRTLTGLDPAKNYLFSAWRRTGSGPWQRVITRYPALDGRTSLTVNLGSDSNLGAGTYDQAEFVEDPGGASLPEGWIPENRLGRVDWFITDHLGSTKLLIDQNGQHRFTGDDDPFGINLRSFGDKGTNRFTGQILDEEQGLYYYGARYYLPEIGRFVSGDPMRQYNSLYIYCANNPLSLVDPTGMVGTWNPFSSAFWTSVNWASAPPPIDLGGATVEVVADMPSLTPILNPHGHTVDGDFATNAQLPQIQQDGQVAEMLCHAAGCKNPITAAGYMARQGMQDGSVSDQNITALLAVENVQRATLGQQTTGYNPWPGGWAPNNEFGEAVPGRNVTLPTGTLLHRNGEAIGRYFTLPGTPFSERGLPLSSAGTGTLYLTTAPVVMRMSIVAPANGSAGGAIQYFSPILPPSLVQTGK